MSKLRNLIEQGPKLCGAIFHEQWSFPYLAAFDADRLKKTKIFDLKPGQTIEDRLEILKGIYLASGVNVRRAGYWIDLITLCAYSYAVAQGHTEFASRRDTLAGMLSTVEGDNLEIASVMSVQEASTLTIWD